MQFRPSHFFESWSNFPSTYWHMLAKTPWIKYASLVSFAVNPNSFARIIAMDLVLRTTGCSMEESAGEQINVQVYKGVWNQNDGIPVPRPKLYYILLFSHSTHEIAGFEKTQWNVAWKGNTFYFLRVLQVRSGRWAWPLRWGWSWSEVRLPLCRRQVFDLRWLPRHDSIWYRWAGSFRLFKNLREIMVLAARFWVIHRMVHMSDLMIWILIRFMCMVFFSSYLILTDTFTP